MLYQLLLVAFLLVRQNLFSHSSPAYKRGTLLVTFFDKNVDFVTGFLKIAENYKQAVEQSGVKRILHLSSIGGHTNNGIGSLSVYNGVENIFKQLPDEVSIKFMRPVAFYTNIFRFMQTRETQGAFIELRR